MYEFLVTDSAFPGACHPLGQVRPVLGRITVNGQLLSRLHVRIVTLLGPQIASAVAPLNLCYMSGALTAFRSAYGLTSNTASPVAATTPASGIT